MPDRQQHQSDPAVSPVSTDDLPGGCEVMNMLTFFERNPRVFGMRYRNQDDVVSLRQSANRKVGTF
jgi:hypothetical protein